jgi:hypothetical protein
MVYIISQPSRLRKIERSNESGDDLGNHMYSHPDVNPVSRTGRAEDHVWQSGIGPLLESVSRKHRFLPFPYNHTGDSEEQDTIAPLLSAHGYPSAPCTIDNTDYKFDETCVRLFPVRTAIYSWMCAGGCTALSRDGLDAVV